MFGISLLSPEVNASSSGARPTPRDGAASAAASPRAAATLPRDEQPAAQALNIVDWLLSNFVPSTQPTPAQDDASEHGLGPRTHSQAAERARRRCPPAACWVRDRRSPPCALPRTAPALTPKVRAVRGADLAELATAAGGRAQ